MEKLILTLPMMPVDGKNYGKFVTPILCETYKKMFGGEYKHCINLLDSFNDREPNLNNYVNSLINNNIKYDSLWIDKNHIEEFLKNIDILIMNNYIEELNTSIYKCDCGVIEIEKNKIETCNPNGFQFEIKNDLMYCKKCGTLCKEYNEKVLAFIPRNIKISDFKISPTYYKNTCKTYEKTILNSYTTISRSRNTGYSINYNNHKYNIDIDFLWSTYLSTFPNKEKVIVSGNKVLYQLFMVAVVEKCLNNNANTILIPTPYISNIKNIVESPNFIEDETFRKLAIIFNMKWNLSTNNYDEGKLKFLKRLNKEQIEKLYEFVVRLNCDSLTEKNMESIIRNNFNMQNAAKTLKKKRGN